MLAMLPWLPVVAPFGLSFGRKTAFATCVAIASSSWFQLKYIENFFIDFSSSFVVVVFQVFNFNVKFFHTRWLHY